MPFTVSNSSLGPLLYRVTHTATKIMKEILPPMPIRPTTTPANVPASLDHAADAAAAARKSDADAQMELQNRTPAPLDPVESMHPGAAAMSQFVDWQGNVLARLGLLSLSGDVRADNATLTAALARVAAAGAPVPEVVRETIAWPGGPILPAGAFTVDVYIYTHPYNPAVRVRSTEFLLAANPAVTIAELETVGIIPAA